MSHASTLARALHQFFLHYLPQQRATSPHTVQSYRDSWKLLLQFAADRVGARTPLEVEHLTVARVLAFLQHLETTRHNGASTRNVRLSAIHSFFRYLGAQDVQHLALSQRILGIPFKRTDSREIQHLEQAEIKAVINGIDRSTPAGRRDSLPREGLAHVGFAQQGVDVGCFHTRTSNPSSSMPSMMSPM